MWCLVWGAFFHSVPYRRCQYFLLVYHCRHHWCQCQQQPFHHLLWQTHQFHLQWGFQWVLTLSSYGKVWCQCQTSWLRKPLSWNLWRWEMSCLIPHWGRMKKQVAKTILSLQHRDLECVKDILIAVATVLQSSGRSIVTYLSFNAARVHIVSGYSHQLHQGFSWSSTDTAWPSIWNTLSGGSN